MPRTREDSIKMMLAWAGVLSGLLALIVFLAWLVPFALSHIKGGKQEAVCALVIDRTTSDNNIQYQENFKRLADETLTSCAEISATLDVWTIDQNGMSGSLHGQFPLFGSSVSGPLRATQLKKNLTEAKNAISSIFRDQAQTNIGDSNIIGVLHDAASTAKSQAPSKGTKKYLVVLTDGIQITSDLTVGSLNSLSADPNQLATSAKLLIPGLNFSGINTTFYGVNSGEVGSTSQQLPLWFELKVRQFWNDVISQNGGRLCQYQTDQAQSAILQNCGA